MLQTTKKQGENPPLKGKQKAIRKRDVCTDIPGKPVSFKVDEGLWGHGRAPAKPGAPSPSRDGGIVPQDTSW